MTNMELSALENARRSSKSWTPEGYDGRTHFAALVIAFVPALLIVAIAGFVLQTVL